jgi:hypothetical protein
LNTILGGFIAGVVGLTVSWWNRRRDGRDRFIAVISEIYSKLDSGDGTDSHARSVHASSIADLRTAIFSVQPFVCHVSFKRLLKIWQDYKNEDVSARGAFKRDTRVEGQVKQTPEPYTVDTLRAYLKKMQDEVG